jgi:hypothetical protein
MKRIVFTALGVAFFATAAWAHGEFSWIQERDRRTGEACCGEHDCYKVQVENITGGYIFRHGDLGYSVTHREVKASEDGQYWACIPRPGLLRCFFAPPNGS